MGASSIDALSCCDASDTMMATSACGANKAKPVIDARCTSQTSDKLSKDACCSRSKVDDKENNDRPSCCQGKPSPCCDTSCLDRIAFRECNQGQPSQISKCSITNNQPCENHRRSARSKYAATLDALGCICRALLALGQESCCPPPKDARSSFNKTRRSTESTRSVFRASTDTCCSGESPKLDRQRSGSSVKNKPLGSCCESTASTKNAKTHEPTLKNAPEGPDICSKGCCGGTDRMIPSTQAASTTKISAGCPEYYSVGEEIKANGPSTLKGCCGISSNPSVIKRYPFPVRTASATDGCSDGCCDGPRPSPYLKAQEVVEKDKLSSSDGCYTSCRGTDDPSARASPKLNNPNTSSTGCFGGDPVSPRTPNQIEKPPGKDLEKGLTGREHVILSVSGMTCTGCETKLKRTLGTLPSVNNLKTSLVLSRAEFNLDTGVQPYDEVIKYMQRTTEFKYERILDRGSSIDVVVTDASEFMKREWPRGVTDMAFTDKKTVNVAFDAKIIGARDLVEQGWDRPLELAAPRGDPTLKAGNKHVRHIGYMTLVSIVLTIPVLVLAWAPLPEREITYGSTSLALATIVQVVIAGPFYPKALKALVFSRIIEMDLLIVLSTSAAYMFSVVSFGHIVAGQPLSTGEFFETSTLLVTLIMVGRYVAALARQKAVESISVHSLQTHTAILVDESGAGEKEVDVRLLHYGDVFKVVPDSKIPTDGTVISGSSEINESMITGESIPVEKYPRSAVVAGSINGSGVLLVKLTRLAADNTISQIAGMVDQAKLSKPKIQDIANRVASYFVPVVVSLTVITFVIWIAIGTAVRDQSGSRAITEAITYAITVLIVSCPCAIGLAVPMVIVIASGVAAERGVIFKSADSIEVAYKASHIIFDKTGTLTQGKLTVAVEDIINPNPESMSFLLGLIESNKHPISAAVAAYLKEKGISASGVPNAQALTGKGVESVTPGLTLRAGNSRWLNLSSDPRVCSILEENYTAFCFTINDSLAAVFGLEDSLRPDAMETTTVLRKQDISVHILSGDDDGPVRSIAAQLHVPEDNIRARCTPSDKQAYIQSLLSNAPNPPVTIFIGDGTNDAPALATATVGVHVAQDTGTGNATELAKSAADVILMRTNLSSILTMMNVSKKAVGRVKFNFAWSFVYNLFAVLLGAGAFVSVHARIPPQFAGLGEVVSVLPVVVAAVLLRWERV
ncbi:E1-E2 ATPase-domain-containing protein [Aspergillus crustosus]